MCLFLRMLYRRVQYNSGSQPNLFARSTFFTIYFSHMLFPLFLQITRLRRCKKPAHIGLFYRRAETLAGCAVGLCCPPLPRKRRDRQTDKLTDGRTSDRYITLTARRGTCDNMHVVLKNLTLFRMLVSAGGC